MYCLVRRKNNEEPLARLKQKIVFYFGNEYFEKYKDRIQVVEGDIVERNFKLSKEDYELVKENTLYIDQNISGIYTITKYKAEMIVLRAVEEGLDAQVLRMGNITNRYSDGVFQQNVEENAFAKRLKSFIELGVFPEYLLAHAIELGPVDLSAEAVVKILGYNSNCNVFHIYNPKLLPIKLLINTLHELGININGVDNETMSKKLTEILNDDFKKEILSGIIHDIDSNKQLIYTSNVRIDYEFTEKYLEKIGFSWKEIDKEYRSTLINFGQSKYFIINFTMAKLMEMEQTDRNKIALYLFNSIEE